MKTEVTKENGVFGITATGIKSTEDVKEVIRQCQLVESQLADGSEKCTFTKSKRLLAHGPIVIQ